MCFPSTECREGEPGGRVSRSLKDDKKVAGDEKSAASTPVDLEAHMRRESGFFLQEGASGNGGKKGGKKGKK